VRTIGDITIQRHKLESECDTSTFRVALECVGHRVRTSNTEQGSQEALTKVTSLLQSCHTSFGLKEGVAEAIIDGFSHLFRDRYNPPAYMSASQEIEVVDTNLFLHYSQDFVNDLNKGAAVVLCYTSLSEISNHNFDLYVDLLKSNASWFNPQLHIFPNEFMNATYHRQLRKNSNDEIYESSHNDINDRAILAAASFLNSNILLKS
jgi:PIN domain